MLTLIAGACTLLTLFVSPDRLPLTGTATYYSQDVMERVAVRRGLGPCTECVGLAAMVDNYIGQRIWLTWPDGVTDGPYLVVDVGAAVHREAHIARGLIVEVDYETAMRKQMRGPVPGVTVRFSAPAPAPPPASVYWPCYAADWPDRMCRGRPSC